MEEKGKNPVVLYFYNSQGEEEKGVLEDTVIVSEKMLHERIQDIPCTPFELFSPLYLKTGDKINLILERDYLCMNLEVLDYKKNPLPPLLSGIVLRDSDLYASLENLMKDNIDSAEIIVVRCEDGSRIWFFDQFGCLLEDMEKRIAETHKEKERRPFYKKFGFWLFISILFILFWSIFVNN